MLFVYYSVSGRNLGDLDFGRAIQSQRLSLVFAHFDAFVGDTFRSIIRQKPGILRKEKSLKWTEILDFGNWDRLISEMTETLVYDLGWKDIEGKLSFFAEKFGMEIEIDCDDRALLSAGERLRHLIIHNGGKVSAEHIRRTGDSTQKIGDSAEIDPKRVDDITMVLRKAASDLFKAVSKTFYDKEPSDLTAIPTFGTVEKKAT